MMDVGTRIRDDLCFIGEGAFYGCSSIMIVRMPYSVTRIGWCAFSDCQNLTSITIPDNKKLVNADNVDDEWSVERLLNNKDTSPKLLLVDK